MNRLIVIVGFMGCGKTEVANQLATRLSLQFIDLDSRITEVDGRSPAQLIREEGERLFRTIETRILTNVLSENESAVVALGGGAWTESVNRDLIREKPAVSVWLDTPFDICWERISTSNEDRPLGATRDEAHARFQRRLPLYQLADVRIGSNATDDPNTLALKIEAEIRKLI
jgi:shikimate kinase